MITLTNISDFVEQPGRRVVRQKRNALDTLDTIFIGPTSLEMLNMPAWGSKHPEFPFMVCETAEVTSREGAISEVKAHYVGKIRSQTSVIVTTPIIETSWHESEISWTNCVGLISHTITPAQGTTPAVVASAYQMVSYKMRYTSKAVTYKYITNLRPDVNDDTFDGTFAGPATNYLGFKNLVQESTGSSITLDAAQAIQNKLGSLDALTDVQIHDMDNGWYEVSEIYMRRFVVNSTLLTVVTNSFAHAAVIAPGAITPFTP